MSDLHTPQKTRKETFLAAAAGESVTLPEPLSREEKYLNAIAEGGGGGGASAPLVVTYTITGKSGNAYTLSYSHTLAQIAAARAEGREVLAQVTVTMPNYGNVPVTLPSVVRMAPGAEMFSGVYCSGYPGLLQIAHIDDNGYEFAVMEGAMLTTVQMVESIFRYDDSTGTLNINQAAM